mmetsp:Transcript_10277/g.29230  ORF Transcript_10277/g.29230 Transcript_10277/m.29230 type:complete len:367 (-) Transcript_10277:352-1452(-)
MDVSWLRRVAQLEHVLVRSQLLPRRQSAPTSRCEGDEAGGGANLRAAHLDVLLDELPLRLRGSVGEGELRDEHVRAGHPGGGRLLARLRREDLALEPVGLVRQALQLPRSPHDVGALDGVFREHRDEVAVQRVVRAVLAGDVLHEKRVRPRVGHRLQPFEPEGQEPAVRCEQLPQRDQRDVPDNQGMRPQQRQVPVLLPGLQLVQWYHPRADHGIDAKAHQDVELVTLAWHLAEGLRAAEKVVGRVHGEAHDNQDPEDATSEREKLAEHETVQTRDLNHLVVRHLGRGGKPAEGEQSRIRKLRIVVVRLLHEPVREDERISGLQVQEQSHAYQAGEGAHTNGAGQRPQVAVVVPVHPLQLRLASLR